MRLSEISKYAMTQKEHDALIARKRRAKYLSITGGTLGLAALGTRVPQGVKAAASHNAKLRSGALVQRMIANEPQMTSASNTLTTLGAGTGAIGSFNFAGLQRREMNRDKAAGPLVKADDRFLRENRDRISPKAEYGYQRMRTVRDRNRNKAIAEGTLSASNFAAAGYYVRKKNPVLAAAGGLGMLGMAGLAVQDAKTAMGYERRMEDNIRAAARRRKAAGLYGPGRGIDPVDPSSKQIGKALRISLRPRGMSYGVRRGGLVRLPSGRQISRRGAVPGTGDFRR